MLGSVPCRTDAVLAPAVGMVVLAALLAAPAPARAERSVEVYRPAHRLAEELAPLARTALGVQGSVAVDPGTNALVLVGERAAVEEALILLRRQDRAQQSVILHLESRTESELAAARLAVAWSVEAGSLRVGTLRGPEGSGVRVALRSLEREGREGLRATVRVLNGQAAAIGAGEERLIALPGGRLPGAAVVSADRGLVAVPRVLGDGRVRVEIEPADARLGPDGSVFRSGAATTVVVRPGETVAIGGLDRDTGEGRRGSSGASRRRAAEVRLLLLSVELPDSASPEAGTP